jgi:branched-chain amino acid transport system ATP-binding protein
MLLQVEDIHSYYGKSHILHGVSMQLNRGDIVCILGRNGVGKSTTLNSIMGIVTPRKGSVRLNGEELAGKHPFQISRKGIGVVPEERRIFAGLTVKENLLIGLQEKRKKISDNGLVWNLDRVFEYFPRLYERKNQMGNHLSGGEQQMLTIARTLMGNPELLLIDEPTEGLAPLIVKMVMEMLEGVSKAGVTILLVEQNFKAAIKLAHRFYIMGKGRIVFEGDREALMAEDDTRKQYLEV